MDESEILKLIEEEEGSRLEFKEKFNDSVLKTISAFANTSGGVIIIGVSNGKQIVGIDLNDENLQRITNGIIDHLNISPEIETVKINDKLLLIIKVGKSNIPISFRGRYYKRAGNTTREMNFEELKRFFQRDLRWERLSEREFRFDDIDEKTVRNFLSSAKAKGRLTVFSGNEPLEEIFERLGLMEKGHINNAGMLLFGENPQKYFGHAKVRVVCLKDDVTIIGDRWIEGNLFKQFAETEEAIKNFINVRYEIKGFEREDIWDYPLEAIREGIANALLHRDYLRPINVQIKVYDDRMRIFNVGGLPDEWDTEKILSSHSSMPRNPIIFHIFYLAGIVENVGSGIERMFKALKHAGLPDPKITASHSEFELMFMKDIYTEEYLRNLGLNERQIELIKYIKNHGVITLLTARNLIPTVSEKTLYRDLQDLVKKEILKEMGDKKGRKYAFL